jgi:uncharacterized membrane protein
MQFLDDTVNTLIGAFCVLGPVFVIPNVLTLGIESAIKGNEGSAYGYFLATLVLAIILSVNLVTIVSKHLRKERVLDGRERRNQEVSAQ